MRRIKRRIKLTNRLLNAIAEMAAKVEAGSPDDYLGYDNAETRKAYDDAVDAGDWARQELARRRERKAKIGK